MNVVCLTGRLVRDVELNQAGTCGRYKLAVDRDFKKDGEPTADFITCVVFNKSAAWASNYFCKGKKVEVSGHLQTSSYEKDGNKINKMEVIVDKQGFCESKKAQDGVVTVEEFTSKDFMAIPDGFGDGELPFD